MKEFKVIIKNPLFWTEIFVIKRINKLKEKFKK